LAQVGKWSGLIIDTPDDWILPKDSRGYSKSIWALSGVVSAKRTSTPIRRTGFQCERRLGRGETEILQDGRELDDFRSRAGKVVELQFHKNLSYRSRRFLIEMWG
jgi:hypothetical protein